MLGWILIIVLVILLIGLLPQWPHSRSWGYYPSGGIFGEALHARHGIPVAALLEGDAAAGIAREARRLRPDLLVVGRGRGDADGPAGETLRLLLREPECPCC